LGEAQLFGGCEGLNRGRGRVSGRTNQGLICPELTRNPPLVYANQKRRLKQEARKKDAPKKSK